MKKQQKEKIKKGLLTTLNIIGYVCIGITLIVGIMVGVNSCKPKTQVQSYDPVSLKANDKRVYTNNDLSQLNNFNNYYATINTEANSVYYLSANVSYPNNGIKIYSYNSNLTSSNYGVYLVNKTANTVNYYQGSYISVYSDMFNIGSPSRYTSVYFNTTDKLLLVFEDYRLWYEDTSTGSREGCVSFFNDILVYVDKTISTQNYGNEYLSLNYDYYTSQINNNWIKGGQTYLFPFVLPQYLNNNFVYCPVYTLDQNDDIYRYYNFVGFDVTWFTNNDAFYGKGCYFINTISVDLNVIFKPVASAYSSYLGYSNYGAIDNLNRFYYFGTYAGCYKQSDTYKYFLGYSYLYNDVYANYNLKFVEGSLNISFNAYNLFNMLRSDNHATLFSNAYLIYDGNAFSGVSVNYNPVPGITGGESWAVNYFNDLGSITKTDFYDPIVSAQFIRYNYFEMHRAIEHFYNNSYFTKLNAPYIYDNPYSDIQVGGGSTDTSGLGSAMDLIGKAFTSISDILSLQLFGAFTLGSLVFIPLVVTIILFVMKMFKR